MNLVDKINQTPERRRKRSALGKRGRYQVVDGISKRRKLNPKVMVLFNGPTSGGKTSLAKAITEMYGDRFVSISRDDYVTEKLAPAVVEFWRGLYPDEPMPLRVEASEENKRLVDNYPNKYQNMSFFIGVHWDELKSYSLNESVDKEFYTEVEELYQSDERSLIVDSAFGIRAEFEYWMKELRDKILVDGWRVYFVKVDCHVDNQISLGEIRRRTEKRGDRFLANIDVQIPVMHVYEMRDGSKRKKEYDLKLYTKDRSPENLVKMLIGFIDKDEESKAILKNASIINDVDLIRAADNKNCSSTDCFARLSELFGC